MRTESTHASGLPSPPHRPPPAVWLRVALVLAIALALAAAIANSTTDTPYEDRLVQLALQQSHAPQWDRFAAQPSAVQALLLDYDPELAFKAQLAIEKYGDDARDVLLRFCDDPTFQEVLREYGENAVPVVAYFVHNDVASMRALYLAEQKGNNALAAAKDFWASLWPAAPLEAPPAAEKSPDAAQPPEVYGPDLRGQRAIAFIAQEGHAFLGQFVLDAQGKADWVQTERALEGVKSFFFSGVVGAEKKYRSGQVLQAADVLNAGLDVFIVAGTFKALKFLRATQQVRKVGVLQRTQLLGAPLLRHSTLGRYAMRYGVAAGTVYLVVRHPSLLSGAFVAVGQWLGISPFLAKIAGWGLLLAPLLLPLLSLLALALNVAGRLCMGADQGLRRARWLLGFSRRSA